MDCRFKPMNIPHMLTATGRQYALLGVDALVDNPPDIHDIAHHLAQLNRFTGACSRPYSVAEHSMLVERIGQARGASPTLRLALLLHDAHEAYTNDIATVAKICIGAEWYAYEAHHAANLRRHFGLKTAFAGRRDEITACDLIALATERRDLMPFDAAVHLPWGVLDTPGRKVPPWEAETIDADTAPLDWRGMRDAFLSRFVLLRELQAKELEARLC